ncbi:MAG: hypothetical protein JWO36_7328 [Myxococcales bacterium]|nr:hypothetical protein [Myxococcales bacterium]
MPRSFPWPWSASFTFLLVACTNDPSPRLINGGGIGDGEIDGTLNIYVIDHDTKAAIVNATVDVGAREGKTNAKGLVTFKDLSGPQTVAVKATGYASVAWVGANGANVTIPLDGTAAVPQAKLSGTVAGWDTVTVPTGHAKAAAIFYSQTDELGSNANNLKTPNGGNFCGVGMATCSWTLVSRTGTLTVIAAIVDIDPKVVSDPNDDVITIIGWATKSGVTVQDAIDQSGLILTQVEVGNLQNVAIDYGSPPAALTDKAAIIGIEVSNSEVVQLPLFSTVKDSMLAPKPTVFSPTATYRLTAVAQTTTADKGAQSILIRHNLSSTSLAAGSWLVPPTGVTVTRAKATFDKITNAKIYTVEWDDSAGTKLLGITLLDGSTSVDVPALVMLPASGTLTAKVQGIGADIDVTSFSLDDDKALLWGVAAEPITIN